MERRNNEVTKIVCDGRKILKRSLAFSVGTSNRHFRGKKAKSLLYFMWVSAGQHCGMSIMKVIIIYAMASVRRQVT